MPYTQVATAVAEWTDDCPLIFTMRDCADVQDDSVRRTYPFDLSDLQIGCTQRFLQSLKDLLLERRSRVQIRTIFTEYSNIKAICKKLIGRRALTRKIDAVDEAFLTAVSAAKVPSTQTATLRRYFKQYPEDSLFAANLRIEDFPTDIEKRGTHGAAIDRVLTKALTRAACVEILHSVAEAYDTGELDLGRFAFAHLAFAIYVRPESYCQITVSDLQFDKTSNRFYIHVPSAKAGTASAMRIPFALSEEVGLILRKQQIQVVARYSSLVTREQEPMDSDEDHLKRNEAAVSRLPLFPSQRISSDGTRWTYDGPNGDGGHLQPNAFFAAYFQPIQDIAANVQGRLNATNLRHTVGTNLALAGCSAKTIAAVLKHANDRTCRKYVDIAFKGLMDPLDEALQPAFDEHLPAYKLFRSIHDPIPADKAVHSDDIETGREALIAECGKSIRCDHAPLSCYGCIRSIPCHDADHSINRDIAQRELDRYKNAGPQFRKLAAKAQSLLNRINVVILACDTYHKAIAHESAP